MPGKSLGCRPLPLSPPLARLLRDHMRAFIPPGDDAVVFGTRTGRSLRAASAMFLYAHNATPTDVQRHLDHATAAAALRYQRTSEQRHRAHATLLAEEFIPDPEKPTTRQAPRQR